MVNFKLHIFSQPEEHVGTQALCWCGTSKRASTYYAWRQADWASVRSSINCAEGIELILCNFAVYLAIAYRNYSMAIEKNVENIRITWNDVGLRCGLNDLAFDRLCFAQTTININRYWNLRVTHVTYQVPGFQHLLKLHWLSFCCCCCQHFPIAIYTDRGSMGKITQH